MSDEKHDEKRHHQRIVFKMSASIRDDCGTERECKLIDLSMKGALIAVDGTTSFQLNENFDLVLALEDGTTIVMPVSVARITASRIGVHCKQIDSESASHLRRILEFNLSDPALVVRDLVKEMDED